MFPLSGIIGRVVYAILAGVIAFLIFWILGVIINSFNVAIGTKLEDFAPLIGLLVGLVYFFAGPQRTGPVV